MAFLFNGREECTIQDISFEGGLARMSFRLRDGETLERTIRNDEVDFVCMVDRRTSVLLPMLCPTTASTASATRWP